MTVVFEVLVKDELRSGRVDRWTQGEGMEAADPLAILSPVLCRCR